MSSNRAAIARATMARFAYTSMFERVLPRSLAGDAEYGALTAVSGASSNIVINVPEVTTNPNEQDGVKDAYFFGVVNADGAHNVFVGTTDGTLINGSPTSIIPASAGAFGLYFWSNVNQSWSALMGGGGGATGEPITSNSVLGGVVAVDNSQAVAATIDVNVLAAGQHILVNFDCELDTEGSAGATVTFRKEFDSTTLTDTRLLTVTGSNSYVVAFHYLIAPSTGTHTIKVTAQSTEVGTCTIPAPGARLSTVLLPG